MSLADATTTEPALPCRPALRPPALATTAVAIAVLGFLALYLYLVRNVGLANDEWTFLLYRAHGFQTIVLPYNNGPVVGEILLYRWWAATVGVAHHWVLSLVFSALQAVVAVLMFGMARRRAGPWAGLAVMLLVLFLGRAWETMLFPATLTFVAPALAGCAAWAALDAHPRWWNAVAVALLLMVAAVTGGLAPALLLGLLVEIAVSRRWRWIWPLAVGAVPLVAWYASEGGQTGTHLGANLPHLPLWAVKYLVASAGAVFGLPPPGGIAVIVGAGALIFVWRRGARPQRVWSPRALGLLVTLAVAVATIGAARAGNTPPSSSRYLYFPAIVMLLLACEWARGLPVARPRLAAAAAVVVALAAGLGVQQLRDGKVFYLDHADGTAARMGAVELAHGPKAVVEPSGLAYTPAVLDQFIARYGREPIDTEAQLARALPQSRAAADQVLAEAEVIRAGRRRRCLPWPRGAALPHHTETVLIASRRPGSAELIRFAPPGAGVTFPLRVPTTSFGLRPDHGLRPWSLMVPAGATISVCA